MSEATRKRKLAGWARAVKGLLASDEGEGPEPPLFVIPGRAEREPGIDTHDGGVATPGPRRSGASRNDEGPSWRGDFSTVIPGRAT